jgi:hypothetical protein
LAYSYDNQKAAAIDFNNDTSAKRMKEKGMNDNWLLRQIRVPYHPVMAVAEICYSVNCWGLTPLFVQTFFSPAVNHPGDVDYKKEHGYRQCSREHSALRVCQVPLGFNLGQDHRNNLSVGKIEHHYQTEQDENIGSVAF